MHYFYHQWLVSLETLFTCTLYMLQAKPCIFVSQIYGFKTAGLTLLFRLYWIISPKAFSIYYSSFMALGFWNDSKINTLPCINTERFKHCFLNRSLFSSIQFNVYREVFLDDSFFYCIVNLHVCLQVFSLISAIKIYHITSSTPMLFYCSRLKT